MPANFIQLAIYIIVFVSVVLLAEAVYSYASSKRSYKKKINKRLLVIEKSQHGLDALLQLRKKRILSGEGKYIIPILALNRLILQSGIEIGLTKLLLYTIFIVACLFFALTAFKFGLTLSLYVAASLGALLPLTVLALLRRRRRRRIEEQLPEALDVLRRSLHAGHPISVAISTVGREMPDPIGSEFGMAADEMTYGLDIETALANMSARVGQADLALLVICVSIQSKSGGNLTELLERLTILIRERQTLRRKVRALSAEGRFSALALSLLPIILFAVLLVVSPEYYGEVWEHPWVKPGLAISGTLMIIGDLIMYKMVNFKF